MPDRHIHHVPGRLRIRVAELKRDTERAETVRNAVAIAAGVKSVEVNAITGSLIVYYDATALNASALLALIGEHCDVRHGRAVQPEGAHLQSKVAEAVFWYALEKMVERSAPLVLARLL
jgi:hypothetical protein